MTQGEPKFPEEWDGRTFSGAWPRPQRIIHEPPQWRTGPDNSALVQRVTELERRVARLETMQRRKPKRKAGRR